MIDEDVDDTTPAILDAGGKRARRRETRACPRCSAPPERRRLSGGFGEPHDVCGNCGHDFEERTL